MFCLSMFCLFYVFAFRCFVVLCFVIDPSKYTCIFINKNSAEVDIAPAFGEITTACNVGQAKKGHGACL